MIITNYKYSCTRYGWQITYQGTIVAGQSLNKSLLKKEPDIMWYEYHRDCAKQALLEIIRK